MWKYIIKDYSPAESTEVKKFNEELPEFCPEIFRKKDWTSFLDMSDEEFEKQFGNIHY